VASVLSTKRELRQFLTIELEYCLPAPQYTNVDWLSDIWQGKRKVSQGSFLSEGNFL
jgi:hypothetical protein